MTREMLERATASARRKPSATDGSSVSNPVAAGRTSLLYRMAGAPGVGRRLVRKRKNE